jgi:hypothetical protein
MPWSSKISGPRGVSAGKIVLGAAVTALAVIVPLFFLGIPSGHDFQFHAASWLEAAGQWKQGVFYPRWAEWANYGLGEPRFIFYPPLSWMLGGALGLVLPWNAVPGALIALIVFIAAISMYAFARRWLPESRTGRDAAERAALLAAVFYAANPYALVAFYFRSDFAEALASAVYPLALLATFDIVLKEVPPAGRPMRGSVALGAAAFAAMWLANAPAGLLASYSLALVFAVGAWMQRSLRPLVAGAAVLALGFLLSAFYLLPAVYEQRWVHIGEVLASGLRPADNFLFTSIADPEHNWFNILVSSVAVGMIVLAGIAALIARRRWGGGNEHCPENCWRLLVLLAAASTALMLPLSGVLWRWLPKFAFLQFPWRWLVVLAAPLACFLATSVAASRRRLVWAGLVLALFAGTGWFLTRQAWWDSEDIPVLRQAIAQGRGYEGTDEYDPAGDDRSELRQRAPRLALLTVEEPVEQGEKAAPPDAGKFRVERWKAEEKRIVVEAHGPVRVALRLLNYPAWRVEVNGREVHPEKPEQTAQMLIPVTRGESRIRVVFTRTRDRAVGLALSLAGVAIFLALLWLRWPACR